MSHFSLQPIQGKVSLLLEARQKELDDLNAKFSSSRSHELRSIFEAVKAANESLRQQMGQLQVQNDEITIQLKAILDAFRKIVGVPPVGAVTLAFTDVQGSTSQWEMHPAVMEKALAMHNKVIRECIDRMHGYEVKTEGDAFMVAFQDPFQAVCWALEVQEKLLLAPWDPEVGKHPDGEEEKTKGGSILWRGLRVRIGLHCGEPRCQPDSITGRMDYFGPMVNKSARVEGGAHGGQIVISGAMMEAIKEELESKEETLGWRGLGDHPLKGIEGTTALYEVYSKSLAERKFPPPFQKHLPAPTGRITLVFTDVQSSTSQWETHANVMAAALIRHNILMRRYIRMYNGYEVRTEGDAFMVAFQEPHDAVNWGMSCQLALMELDWPEETFNHPDSAIEKDENGKVIFRGYRVRMGMHTGTPRCELDPVTGRMGYFGKMVARTGRVEGLTYGAQINLSSATWMALEKDKLLPYTSSTVGTFDMEGLDMKDTITMILPKELETRKFPPPKGQSNLARSDDVEPPVGTVTLCNTDVQGSTTQWEMHPDVMQPGLVMHNNLMRKLIREYKGYEIRTEGDAFFVAFATATNAVNWAITAQEELMKLPWPERLYDHPDSAIEKKENQEEDLFRGMRVRIGIHTGTPLAEPDPRTGRMDYLGPTVRNTSQVEHASHGGQIVVSEDVMNALQESSAEVKLHASKSMGKFIFGNQEVKELFQILPKSLEERTFKATPIAHLRAAPMGRVTIVYTDVQGSTTQWEMHPSVMERSLEIHNVIMRKRIDDFGGYEVKTEGDAFMVAFFTATDAVKWALAVQTDLLRADWPEETYMHPDATIEYLEVGGKKTLIYRGLRVRIGMHTGEPRAEPDPITERMDYFGKAVNIAAGVEGATTGGQILMTGETFNDVEPHLVDLGNPSVRVVGEFNIKGASGKARLVEMLPIVLSKRHFADPLQKPEETKTMSNISNQLSSLQTKNDELQSSLNKIEQSIEESSKNLSSLKSTLLADQLGDLPPELQELIKIIQNQAELQEKLADALRQQQNIKISIRDIEKTMSTMAAKVADSFAAKARVENDLALWEKKKQLMADQEAALAKELEDMQASMKGQRYLTEMLQKCRDYAELTKKERSEAEELRQKISSLGDFVSEEDEAKVLGDLRKQDEKLSAERKELRRQLKHVEKEIEEVSSRVAELEAKPVDEAAVLQHLQKLERIKLHQEAKISIMEDQIEEIEGALNAKRNAPDALNDFAVSKIGPTFFTVKWKPPKSASKITSYAIYLREYTHDEYKLFDYISGKFVKIGDGKSVPGDETKITIEHLEPEKTYELKMRASNDFGWGPRSIRSLKFTTLRQGAQAQKQRKQSITQ